MAGFLLALLAALIAGVGARDQLLTAAMATRRNAGFGVLAVALGTAVLSAGLAGWAGTLAAPLLEPRARIYLIAMALGLAAAEMIVLRPKRLAAEPTESLGALAVVLLAQQVTDAARLLIFALAAGSAVPQFAIAGGMLGCAATAVLGWSAGGKLTALPLHRVRVGLGLLLAATAFYLVV